MLLINFVKPDTLSGSYKGAEGRAQTLTGACMWEAAVSQRNSFYGLTPDVKVQLLPKGTSHTSINTKQVIKRQEESVFSIVNTKSHTVPLMYVPTYSCNCHLLPHSLVSTADACTMLLAAAILFWKSAVASGSPAASTGGRKCRPAMSCAHLHAKQISKDILTDENHLVSR